jgi:hypothetical protein
MVPELRCAHAAGAASCAGWLRDRVNLGICVAAELSADVILSFGASAAVVLSRVLIRQRS